MLKSNDLTQDTGSFRGRSVRGISPDLVSAAYVEACQALEKSVTDRGIKASCQEYGYNAVWGRDSMISLIGASGVRSPRLLEGLRASIRTLRQHQSTTGNIPNKVDLVSHKSNFRSYADGGLWFVIGNWILYEETGDLEFLLENYSAIKKQLHWCEYQDNDGSDLMSIQEGADWEDLFATRGKGLTVNILYFYALSCAAKIADLAGDTSAGTHYEQKSRAVRSAVQSRFWYTPDIDLITVLRDSFGTGAYVGTGTDRRDPLGRKLLLPKKTILQQESYFLPYITLRDFGEWFDSLGNLLAIITGLADAEQARVILDFIKANNLAVPYPIKALYPPISEGEKDWRYYYAFGDQNYPNQYHNGGIWPFIGGFYVLALVEAGQTKEAQEALIELANVNHLGREGEWEFSEWLHGVTGKPAGMVLQTWSAGMYAAAFHAVARHKSQFSTH